MSIMTLSCELREGEKSRQTFNAIKKFDLKLESDTDFRTTLRVSFTRGVLFDKADSGVLTRRNELLFAFVYDFWEIYM